MSARTVLVTGGAGGIGHALSRHFAAQGRPVVATAISQAEIDACPPFPGVRLVVMDVSRADQVAAVFGELGALDLLVNAAGVIRRHAEFDLGVFEQVLSVNLTGMMRTCVAAHPLLAAQGGTIVNIASMLTFFGGGAVPAYSASKGGVGQLTKSLAIAWAPDGVRVNAVAPGWISTPLTAPLEQDTERTRQILGRTPMGRWGRPEDLAGAVDFLASPTAAFITGAILPVDGGYAIA